MPGHTLSRRSAAALSFVLAFASSVSWVPAQAVPDAEMPTVLNEVVVYGREDSLIGEADSPGSYATRLPS